MTTRKPRRSVTYPGPGCGWSIPQPIADETAAYLKRYGARKCEGLAYWAGSVGANGEAVVQALVLVNHKPQGAGVHVTKDEVRNLVRVMAELDLKLLAQVHSHLGDAFHSHGDDEHATSFHEGFVSVVVPRYAMEDSELFDWTIHEYQGGKFVKISPNEVRTRFQVIPLVHELQPVPWSQTAKAKSKQLGVLAWIRKLIGRSRA